MNNLKFLVILGLMYMVSCSSDDPETTPPTPPILEPQKTDLIKIEESILDENGNESLKRDFYFKDGKIQSEEHNYLVSGINKSKEYEYNSKGLPVKIREYEASISVKNIELLYNNSDELIKVLHFDLENSNASYHVTFTFNNDNTVLARTVEQSGNSYDVVYIINENSLIEQELVDGHPNTILDYNSFSVNSKTDMIGEIKYKYVLGTENPNTFFYESFGDYPFNFVFYKGDLDSSSDYFASGLISERVWETHVGVTERFEYDLYTNGLPKSSKRFNSENAPEWLTMETIYYYE